MLSKIKAALRKFWEDPLKLSRYENEVITPKKSSDRVTQWVNAGYKTLNDSDTKLYWWMFGEDLHLRAMPYPRGEAEVILCPADKEIEKKLIKTVDVYRQSAYSLQEAMEDFIRSTTQIIYSYGDAYFEVEKIRNEAGHVKDIKLHLIYNPSVRKVFGQHFQVIKPAAAKHARIKMGITRVPKEKLLHISSPKTLGGRKGLKKIMRGLIGQGSTSTPTFTIEALDRKNNIPFNPKEYDLNRYIYRARLTRRFGWSQRRDTEAPVLEYYWLVRVLRQARAVLDIRNEIVGSLNTMLAGSLLEEGQKIIVKGQYSYKEIDAAIEDLKKGDVNFGDMVKKFL